MFCGKNFEKFDINFLILKNFEKMWNCQHNKSPIFFEVQNFLRIFLFIAQSLWKIELLKSARQIFNVDFEDFWLAHGETAKFWPKIINFHKNAYKSMGNSLVHFSKMSHFLDWYRENSLILKDFIYKIWWFYWILLKIPIFTYIFSKYI